MVTPAPQPFPSPTGIVPPSPDDMFGATPDELRMMEAAGISPGLTTPTGLGSTQDEAAQDDLLTALAGATGAAVSAANDPTQWTQGEAAEQSNVALQKIATVNPDLAAQLQAQRTGEPDTGGGFLDTLKGAVASVAGLPGVSQALDWISRPAQIIPEILGDREHDSVWGNITQAMSGNSEANWHRVLTDRFGIDGPLGAILGFVGDVATDPTTYLMAGLGGIGREAALRVAGEAGFKSTFEKAGTEAATVAERWAQELSVQAGRTITKDEALSIAYRNVTAPGESLAKQGTEAIGKMSQLVHRDAAGGVIGMALRDGEQKLLLQGADVADKALTFASRGGLFGGGRGSLGQKLGEELGVDGQLVDDVLERVRQAGSGHVDKELYMAGKAAAGIQGGIRFKFSLPVFNLRYVTPAIPGTGGLGFRVGRRFVTGMAGEARLQSLVERGVTGAADALNTFWNPLEGQGGFSAVKRLHGDIARQMSKGAFGLGGHLYGASEQVGRLTAHFSPNAMMLRGGGLGSQMVRDWNLATKDFEARFAGDAWNLADETDPAKLRASEDVQREAAAVLAGADEAKLVQFHDYQTTGAAGDLTDEELKALDDLAQVQARAIEQANLHGASPVDPINDYDSAEALHPNDAAGFTQGSHDVVAETEWHVVGDSQGEDLAHVDAGNVRTTDEGTRGVVLEEGPGGAGSAAVRARNVLWVDAREGGQNLTPSVSPMGDYTSNANAAVDELGAGARGLNEPLHLSEAVQAEKKAQIVAAQAKNDGYDAIGYIDADGTKRLVVLDQANVKRVTPDATPLGQGRRHVPHVLTQEAKESLRGVKEADDLKYVGGQAKWEIELEKELVGKTHDEAEAIVRKTLEAKGAKLPPGRLLELDPVKRTSQFVERTGKQTVHSMTGRFARKLENMGFGGAYDLGGAGRRTSRFSPSDVIDRVDDTIKKSRAKLDSVVHGHDLTKERQWRAYQASQRLAKARDRADEALRDAEQGLERKVAGGPTPANYGDEGAGIDFPVGEVDDDYAYHITGEENLESIADEGLKTYSPRAGGKATWHDGGTDDRSFWLDQPPTPIEGKNRLIRKRYDSGGLAREEGTANLYDHARTPVEDLEYLGADGAWHPMSERSAKLRQAGLDVGGPRPKEIVTLEEMDELVRRHKLAKGVADKARAKAEAKAAEVEKLQRQLDKEATYIDDALNEHNKVVGEQHLAVADSMPALRTDKGDLAGFAELKIPGLEGHYMPAYMAVEMNQAARGMKALSGFHLQWRRFMGAWKTWATWMIPGFHIRNVQGAWFNNMLGGVGFKEHVMAFRARRAASEMASLDPSEWNWAKRTLDAQDVRKMGLDFQFGGEPVTYGDLARMTSEVGINRANTNMFGEAMQGAAELDARANKRHAIEYLPGGKRYVRGMRNAGDLTENVFRTAAWIQGMKTTGGDMMGARAFTMLRHGDYSDLTDWESGFVRDLIPFYKWMRTNTPYQIHQLLENPGKITATLHARDAAYGAQGLNFKEEMKKLPPWMQDSFSIPLPGSRSGAMKLLTLDLPMSDLYKGTREYMSSFLPLVKPFIESYVINQSTFTGAPLTNDAVPVEAWLGDLPVVRDVIAAVGLGEVNAEGQLTVSEKTQNVMSIIPVFSRFRDWMFADPDRAKYRANSAMSAFAGVGLRPIDEETLTDNELGFYYQHILPEMERMKSLGWTLPSKDDLQQAGVIADTMTQTEASPAGTDLLDALSQQSA